MKNLVTCMTAGPLRGKGVKLIGHTDPRGSPGYNDKLGLERAEKVKTFLVANGVEATRVETATMGADEASQAPKEWARDRRVEVQLAH
jgi:peptidoglycan-associated lipoprotein